MHIIGLVLSVAAAAGYWYWRLHHLHRAGVAAADHAGRLRGKYNRYRFRRKAESSALSSIEHPGIAAVAYLMALAALDPGNEKEANAIIREGVTGTMLDPKDVDEVMIFAEWASRTAAGPEKVLRVFKSLWQNSLTADEWEQFRELAGKVANAGNGPVPDQRKALQSLLRFFGG